MMNTVVELLSENDYYELLSKLVGLLKLQMYENNNVLDFERRKNTKRNACFIGTLLNNDKLLWTNIHQTKDGILIAELKQKQKNKLPVIIGLVRFQSDYYGTNTMQYMKEICVLNVDQVKVRKIDPNMDQIKYYNSKNEHINRVIKQQHFTITRKYDYESPSVKHTMRQNYYQRYRLLVQNKPIMKIFKSRYFCVECHLREQKCDKNETYNYVQSVIFDTPKKKDRDILKTNVKKEKNCVEASIELGGYHLEQTSPNHFSLYYVIKVDPMLNPLELWIAKTQAIKRLNVLNYFKKHFEKKIK